MTNLPYRAFALAVMLLPAAAAAQTISGSTQPGYGTSSRMWGSSSANGSTLDSSTMHLQDGAGAGQVDAAKLGLLLGAGPNFTITAVGSQNIVSTTIIGDNNGVTNNVSQSSSNSGTVSNNGSIAAPTH